MPRTSRLAVTAPELMAAPVPEQGPARTSRRSLLLVALLMPVGPVCVGLLRYLLPYFTASESTDVVAAAAAAPGRQSAVLWLGYIALLTLVPGVLAAGQVTRDARPRLTAVAMCLLVPAYLSMGLLLSGDALLWAGPRAGLQPATMTALYDETHPTAIIGLGVFVLGHVVGTVLLGIALLRSGRVPAAAAWALTISQPLHFVAAVIVGSPTLDLFAWSLTTVGMGFAARALLRMPSAAVRSGYDQGEVGRSSGSPSTTRSTRSLKKQSRSRIFGHSGIGSG